MSCQTAGFSKWTRFPNCYFILSKFHDSHVELKLKFFLLKTSWNFSKNRTKKAYTWVAIWKDGIYVWFRWSPFYLQAPMGHLFLSFLLLTQKRLLLFPGPGDRLDFSFSPSDTKSSWNQHPTVQESIPQAPLSSPAHNNPPRSHFQDTGAMKSLHTLGCWG